MATLGLVEVTLSPAQAEAHRRVEAQKFRASVAINHLSSALHSLWLSGPNLSRSTVHIQNAEREIQAALSLEAA